MNTDRYRTLFYGILGSLGVFWLLLLGFHIAYMDKVLPGVHVGIVPVGGLSQLEAIERLNEHGDTLAQQGMSIVIEGKSELLQLENIEFRLLAGDTAQSAWQVGRRGSWVQQVRERFSAPFREIHAEPKVAVNERDLSADIDALADVIDLPRKDVRFSIVNTNVQVLTDTQPGRVIDRNFLRGQVLAALHRLDNPTIQIVLADDIPQANPATAPQAKTEAERMMGAAVVLYHDEGAFVISPEQLGSWIISAYKDGKLVPAIDREALGIYIAEIAEKINIPSKDPKIVLQNGRVTEFIPPRAGRGLEEEKTIQLILEILEKRRTGALASSELTLPVAAIKPKGEMAEGFEGIAELIGKATTPFTGSPKNRIHNIKNGAKFLTGHLIKPGEEFSTLQAIGKVDNTTGYLPELVIKGNRTTPEFGGGLCQVSTTLFRAVMNAGLPITARRNHSYRVSYYEKDAQGRTIGPGLDATIYQPNPDFKFRNDSASPIMIYGLVVGDRITFELYGTRDGRTSKIEGPTILGETAPGPAIYTETDQLPKGTVKQVEIAHPGGSTTATYIINYPDGRIVPQVFKSFYRRWPARYLVGTRPAQVTSGQ